MNLIRCVVANKEIQGEWAILKKSILSQKCTCRRLVKEDDKIVKLACGHFLHLECLNRHDALSANVPFGTCPILLDHGNACSKKYVKFNKKTIILKNLSDEALYSARFALVALGIAAIMLMAINNQRLGIQDSDDQNLSRLPTDLTKNEFYLFPDKQSFYLSVLATAILIKLGLAFFKNACAVLRNGSPPIKIDLSQYYQEFSPLAGKNGFLNEFFCNSERK